MNPWFSPHRAVALDATLRGAKQAALLLSPLSGINKGVYWIVPISLGGQSNTDARPMIN